jgi:hypothetical protein
VTTIIALACCLVRHCSHRELSPHQHGRALHVRQMKLAPGNRDNNPPNDAQCAKNTDVQYHRQK